MGGGALRLLLAVGGQWTWKVCLCFLKVATLAKKRRIRTAVGLFPGLLMMYVYVFAVNWSIVFQRLHGIWSCWKHADVAEWCVGSPFVLGPVDVSDVGCRMLVTVFHIL